MEGYDHDKEIAIAKKSNYEVSSDGKSIMSKAKSNKNVSFNMQEDVELKVTKDNMKFVFINDRDNDRFIINE
jgi:hypothetical protein